MKRPFSLSKILHGRLRLALALTAFLCLSLSSAGLVAEQNKPVRLPTNEPPQRTTCQSNLDHPLLPLLPRPKELEDSPLIPGIPNRAPAIQRNIDPDEFKALLGYYGPYYNTKELDGELSVLIQTVHVEPSDLWGASGMVRNQSCVTVRINALTGQLISSSGAILDTVTAAVSIDEVRPGEPAPFILRTNVKSADVKTVIWNVDYVPSETTLRNLKLEIHEADQIAEPFRYLLSGSIHNLDNKVAVETHVVAAWIDREGRVLHVDFPKMRMKGGALVDSVDIMAGHMADFRLIVDDPTLVTLLSGSTVVLWGAAK